MNTSTGTRKNAANFLAWLLLIERLPAMISETRLFEPRTGHRSLFLNPFSARRCRNILSGLKAGRGIFRSSYSSARARKTLRFSLGIDLKDPQQRCARVWSAAVRCRFCSGQLAGRVFKRPTPASKLAAGKRQQAPALLSACAGRFFHCIYVECSSGR